VAAPPFFSNLFLFSFRIGCGLSKDPPNFGIGMTQQQQHCTIGSERCVSAVTTWMGKKKNSKAAAVEEELELSEEELEEEIQDEAARYIQTAFRAKMARNLLKSLIRQNYVKLKDRQTNIYYYKNKTTGETNVMKPKILKEDDLPSPRDFQAPINYDPGYVDEKGFAILIHCSKFTSEKIPNFSHQIDADQKIFEHLLSHDFICKYRPENVFSLKDPSIQTVKDTIERIRRVITKKSYLFIYICTHVVTLHPSSKISSDHCFFCFRETNWKSTNQAALTSLSLTDFSKMIVSLGCDQKVVAVNYAHVEPSRKSFFKTRYLYPPPDCLTRLADLCNCTVIGSCNIGTSIPEMKAHTPQPAQVLKRRGALKLTFDPAGSSKLGTAMRRMNHPVLSTRDVIEKKNSMQIHKSVNDGDDIQHLATDATRELSADLMAHYQQEWITSATIADEKDPQKGAFRLKPKLPGLKWKKISDIGQGADGVSPTAASLADGKEIKTLKSQKSLPSTPKRAKGADRKGEGDQEQKPEYNTQTVEEKEQEAGKQLGVQLSLPSNKEVS
jgi:hypothetical protein